jgi:hypothetical protein
MTSPITPRLRSRRLALVAAALILGLGACGSDDARRTTTADTSSAPVTTTRHSTSPPDDRLPVIRVAEGAGSVRESAAADSPVVGDMNADTKMMAVGIEFVFDGSAEDLTAPAASWFFPPAGLPSEEEVVKLAAQFGVEGPVQQVDEERGGGLTIGPDDFTGPSFTVGTDAMQSWWYSPGDDLSKQPICEPVPASDEVTDGSETEEVVCEPLPAPQNVPTADEAEAKTAALMDQLGLDPASYELETYADEWGASVSAFLLLDGVRSNVSMYFSFREEGAVAWAGGFLATPQRGPEYPRIGVDAAVERLNSPNWMGGFVDPGLQPEELPLPLEDSAGSGDGATQAEPVPGKSPVDTVGADVTIEPVPADSLDRDVLVDPPVCDPAADCVPSERGDMETIVVRLSNPRPALEQLWAEDGTVWLLPAYAFDADDEGLHSVIAIDAAYLSVTRGEPEPGDPGSVDAVPGETKPVDTRPVDTVPVGPDAPVSTDAPAPTEPAAPDTTVGSTVPLDLVGLVLKEAEKVAEQQGFTVRVVREDGEDLAVTDDFRQDRVNVAVVDGVVTEVVGVS